ncbi:MAG TPA: glycoside hydrolase family 5 protein [Luteolibacter sp.]|nr:glycoside hydrolase family 5 protein [Luteolibacter sp.]
MKFQILTWIVVAGTALNAAELPRIPSEARLWLKVPAGQPPLRDVRVSAGHLSPVSWEKNPALRERWTDILWPVTWWAWRELSVSFTAAADGDVELTLLGPWAADENGSMPRQEVLWDQIRVEGAEIQNGGFELPGQATPAGWQSPWGAYPSAESWPLVNAPALEGRRVAAAWCKRPLQQVLHVKGGTTITLVLHARAATPPDFVPPKTLGDNTPAHRALSQLKRGVNLGNGWEAPPGASWGARFTPEDIDQIAAEGFDHIRVPVAWHHHLKPGARGLEIEATLLAQLEPVLRRAMEKNLRVLLDWHHFNELTNAPASHSDRFISGWEAIARHFQSWPPGLFFELLNEPCNKLTAEVANPLYQKSIAVIRETNPQRIIVVSPGDYGAVRELAKLRLPDDDDRLVVTLHTYAPYHFTHQGAGWAGLQAWKGVGYPGPPAVALRVPDSLRANAGLVAFVESYNTLPGEENPCSKRPVRELLDAAREWSAHFGRPVHLGEFGAHDAGDDASRARYLRDVRTLAEERHIPWTLWEWKSNFGYWDPAKGQPRFRASLFE